MTESVKALAGIRGVHKVLNLFNVPDGMGKAADDLNASKEKFVLDEIRTKNGPERHFAALLTLKLTRSVCVIQTGFTEPPQAQAEMKPLKRLNSVLKLGCVLSYRIAGNLRLITSIVEQ